MGFSGSRRWPNAVSTACFRDMICPGRFIAASSAVQRVMPGQGHGIARCNHPTDTTVRNLSPNVGGVSRCDA